MKINYLHLDTLNSTSTWSKENYKQFDQTRLTLVTADQQTAGYGRYKRAWNSPSGLNVYATFTFFVEKEFPFLANTAQIIALSTTHTLEDLEFKPHIKWPNDIMINKKKIAGLLCETIIEENSIVVFVGIGLNVNMPPEILQQVGQPATSLSVEKGHPFKIQEVLQKLQRQISLDLDLFLVEGFSPFFESYKKHLIHQEGDLLVIDHKTGTFQRIDTDGALVLSKDGVESKYYAGEMT